ncbi:hypothetical protein COCSUDRAFT_54055 [Coccomyxa subellipsoidea C-169]|uniref:Uncharacterized protein n=1 Tax=Coccomyxa subellipsoidea (strain C-169) TaxID=574566 RepID=I0YTC1_COCSC|nr:hypothetical protein COCSUDRAFT_54055 [Coccomyxa subellipsoidea C-169]EIE21640.1 hypothetical protein COCSUDRAFT_54055 [Coccomyxa subellipsoidea C-169]|eukprot:XP_005646184.1 hypothetical protein COCSUDRAFT_54055 [Coccomyxa subellipsoidea C-169]
MTAVVVGRRVTLPGPFVGDHDNMVDRLIEACAAVKQRTFVSFERELQPCTEAWLEPAKSVQKREGTPNKERNKKKTKKARAASPPADGPPRTAPQYTVKTATKAVSISTPKQWAGPGYVISPKPEALPLPPASLLRKIAVAA